jgi:hypothetical protein
MEIEMKIMIVLLLTFFTLMAGAATGRKKVFECKSVSNKMSTKIKVLPRSSGARLVVNEESFHGSSLWERSVGKVKNSKSESKQYLKYSDRLGKTHLTIDLLETDSQGRNSGKFKYVDGKGSANYRIVKCDLN